MPIHVLPEIVVAQIAAGEVVERPASVVKELLENSLDAGASHIRIEISEGGRRRIRISDDGSGIPPHEVALAFHRHATSKLQSVADLSHIQTLGFRGEALASIASVSHLTITTRHAEYANGIHTQIVGAETIRQQAIGAPVGTVITVENLFFNTPARLKFMKKDTTEKRQIALIVSRYAMAYPQVRFVLEQDGREVFRSSGSGQLADVLVSALGLDTLKNMVEISSSSAHDTALNAPAVFGYTSAPGLHRADRNHITLFVNGRWIQDTRLSYAITQAYHTFLMTGRYPVSVLMLTVPPEDVDVNVHPTKAEVRFRDNDGVFSLVQRAVRRAIVDLAQAPAMRTGRFAVPSFRADNPSTWEEESPTTQQSTLAWDMPTSGQYRRQALPVVEPDPTAIPYGASAPARPRTLPILRVIGQAAAMYIVAEGPSGIYLVDQHAAHERILYEQFMDEHHRKDLIVQLALEAQTIQLPPTEAQLLEENLDTLTAIGFQIEPFGPGTYVIRTIPALLADQSPIDAIKHILLDLEADKAPGQAAIEQKIVKRVCKQAAIKAGQILSLDEMQRLIQQLERCQSPHTCPHGRPTMLHLTGDQLAREFGRLGS